MNKKNSPEAGSTLIITIILIGVLVGAVGYVFWQNFIHKEPAIVKTVTATKQQETTVTDSSNWTQFSEPTLGLTFKYPKSWGKSQLEVMNAKPDELNKIFYKISFGSNNRIITITPKTSLQSWSTTMTSLKDSINNYPDSRYVLVNTDDQVAIIVPSIGNQDSELYAAKLLTLSKINADTIVLSDGIKYGSSPSCKAETYIDCYSDADRSDIKLFLQELKAE